VRFVLLVFFYFNFLIFVTLNQFTTLKGEFLKKLVFNGLLAATISFATMPAQSEIISGTNLSLHFESAHLIGSGRNININRVPVVDTTTGETTFFDVVFRFSLKEGELVFDKTSSLSISPPLSAALLIPGEYKDQVGRSYTLSEPALLSESRSLYSLIGGDNSFSAQIVTGEPTGHPDIGQREIVTSLSASYIYGIITDKQSQSSGNLGAGNLFWRENQLIGLRQTSDTLSITLFSKESDDFSTPQEGAVLHRVVEE